MGYYDFLPKKCKRTGINGDEWYLENCKGEYEHGYNIDDKYNNFGSNDNDNKMHYIVFETRLNNNKKLKEIREMKRKFDRLKVKNKDETSELKMYGLKFTRKIFLRSNMFVKLLAENNLTIKEMAEITKIAYPFLLKIFHNRINVGPITRKKLLRFVRMFYRDNEKSVYDLFYSYFYFK